jgi:hypothetical protein
MIRITVEIWPGGDETRAREIARMTIANISGLAPESAYEIWASSDANKFGQAAFEASGMTVRHRRKDSIWMLIAKAVDRVAAGWVAASAEK